MKEPRKHHYVPRSYLKFFSLKKDKSNYIINVWDKKIEKPFLRNIEDVAEEKDYNTVENNKYVLSTPNNDPLYYEYLFSDLIEKDIPHIISKLITLSTVCDSRAIVLNDEYKISLAKMIILQLLRTPQARQYTKKIGLPIYNTILNSFNKMVNDNIEDIERRKMFLEAMSGFEYSDELVKSIHLNSTLNADRIEMFIEILVNNHSWIIYNNLCYRQIPFITSDNPVVLYNLANGELGFGINGINVDSTIISMPLTPQLILCLYHKEGLIGSCMDTVKDRIIDIDEFDYIKSQNECQLNQCARQVYEKPRLEK